MLHILTTARLFGMYEACVTINGAAKMGTKMRPTLQWEWGFQLFYVCIQIVPF